MPKFILLLHPLLPAVQEELWREAGDFDRAAACYRTALGLARSRPEHNWLASRLALSALQAPLAP